ncbi:penicillin-binding protein 2 [bacterium]|nr:MAG: penicillin-binding protein 2 [bacterium]
MNPRSIIFSIFLGTVWLILLSRLFYLQVVNSDYFAGRAENNATKMIDQIPARGLIFDRYGKLIVENQPTFSIQITPAEFDTNSSSEFEYLAQRLNMSPAEVRRKIQGVWPYTPVTIKENVDFTLIAKLEEEMVKHPGVHFKVDIHRIYSPDITMPHVIGYLNQITEQTIGYFKTGDFSDTDYKIGELTGAAGIEKFYEIELRGQKGYHELQSDSKGKVVKDLGIVKHPTDGYNLYLTIDLEFQRFVETAMGQNKGSIIVVDVRTGEILAATSKPDYNIRWFVEGISHEQWKELNENPDKPMFNRIVQSGYAPGSTFKMITAIAALEEGLATPETYIECKGVYLLGGNRFRCWNWTGHGHINMQNAITHSCDVYFYTLAWELGINKLAKYARMFGLGEMTGVDLPNEKKGNVPTTDFFDSRYGRNNWKSGTVVNLGIGQGEILVTPIQIAQYVTILANSGKYQQPHFVRYAEDQEGIRKVLYPIKSVPVKPDYLDLMRHGMWAVVNTYEGTGKRAWIKWQAAGKTGTSENVHGNYHGWFAGFAPYYDPEIAVVVIMENGGEGSDVAAPMSATVMNYYFNYIRGRKAFDPSDLKEKQFQSLRNAQLIP